MEFQVLLLTLFLSTFVIFLLSFRRGRGRLPLGPWPWLPVIGHLHLLGPLVHQSLHRLSLRYGPFFSLYLGSVPCVVVSNPHYAKLFLQDNELAFSSRLESTAIKRLTYETSLAFSPYGPYWKFIKKLTFNELFGSRGTGRFSSLRVQEYDRLLTLIGVKARAGEAVNVTEELLKMTNTVISKMMIGESEEARDVIREVTKMFGEFNVADFVWVMKKLDVQGFGKRIEDLYQRFDSLVDRIITKREQARNKARGQGGGKHEGGERDFLDILLDIAADETSDVKINRVHMKGLVMDLFTAATDTLAVGIEWALVELINHPDLLKKARQEIDDVVGNQRLVEESDGPKLPFIQAVIKETFRLHPPVPLVVRRCTSESKIEDYVIPEDTVLMVNVWAMGRDPSLWESPMDFRPERFLKPMEENSSKGVLDVRGQHFQYLPFGTGRRMCSGLTLAMHEVPAVVAALIQCFDFQPVSPQGNKVAVVDTEERPGLTVPRAHELVCIPIARPICGPLHLV
ncbi:licodione synthase-like [Prosopis cineraria]|uniref:licodione synthase-like n=1 Tax=Prosopis cineraria TaxID=364024 RepID=UPI00240F8FEB|nr:licodione synthase-like [Prosopis cineraria]